MTNRLYRLLFFAFLFLLFASCSHQYTNFVIDSFQPRNSFIKGSSFSVEDNPIVLTSTNRAFTCGFINVGSNAYTLSIWFTNTINKTIAWSANRDYPVNGKGSKLTFPKEGNLILTDLDGTVVWTTNGNGNQVHLSDSGNLVLTNFTNKILWQSFDFPIDTLLPGQPIKRNTKLVSSKTDGPVYSGFYSLFFDNNNVLEMLYDGPEISSIYWPDPDIDKWNNGRTDYNSSRFALLDDFGQFNASDKFSFEASDKGEMNMRRLTLDYDGNLRLYSLNELGTWNVTWEAFSSVCLVHGLCGKNGICFHTETKQRCSCPPNYEMTDPSNWSKGCKSKFNITNVNPKSVTFLELPNTDYWGYDINVVYSVSLHHCKMLCKNDSSCLAIHYRSGACFPKSLLYNGKSYPSVPGSMYFKFPRNVGISKASEPQIIDFVCNMKNTTDQSRTYRIRSGDSVKWISFYGFIMVFGIIEILFIGLGWCFIYRTGEDATLAERGYRLMDCQFRKFTYKELREATKNFSELIGTGGSGGVYKGVLDYERVVAVKKLKDVNQREEEFWSEVSIIGTINHMNLVRIIGFCSEGPYRLLVSEFIENGSLDKNLFNEDDQGRLLGWKERFSIALGSAKGLAYLHEECLEWVIHCDVKPGNILLGSDFEPKIADFGLSKLSKRGVSSNISHVRGTRGYMAPEWASNLPITAKVDVYSFGIVLLELVKGKRVSDWTMEDENEFYEEMRKLVHTLNVRHEIDELWVSKYVDPRLCGEFDKRQAKAMVEIALSCLEEDRSKRPNMDLVVQKLVLLSEESLIMEHDFKWSILTNRNRIFSV
ncbi:hypothetical protein LUZ60_010867 [Juncus effusus]|nr:hypothetical protein LUZ60_010867 [Juncus effusus]